jgi:hypothetical protein
LVGWLASAYSSLMMEAVRTSETSVDNHFTRQYNPEDSSEQQYGGCLLGITPESSTRALWQSYQQRHLGQERRNGRRIENFAHQ